MPFDTHWPSDRKLFRHRTYNRPWLAAAALAAVVAAAVLSNWPK